MKKYIVIGDIHFEGNNTDNILLENIKSLSETYDNFIFVGDYIFKDYKSINYKILKSINSLFNILNNKNVILLIGNHDLLDLKTNIFDIIYTPPNFKVIKNVEKIDNILFLPYYYDRAYLKKALKKIDLDDVKFIINHNDFIELYPESLYKIMENEGIQCLSDFLSEYAFNGINFISGHIHLQKIFSIENNNIYNIGCSINRTRNDLNKNVIFAEIVDDNVNIIESNKTPLFLKYFIKSKKDFETALSEIDILSKNNIYKKDVVFNIHKFEGFYDIINKIKEMDLYNEEDVYTYNLITEIPNVDIMSNAFVDTVNYTENGFDVNENIDILDDIVYNIIRKYLENVKDEKFGLNDVEKIFEKYKIKRCISDELSSENT